MRTFVVTPPGPVMTWKEADDHLKLDGDEEQAAYVDSLIAAAAAHLDGPSGWLGRALGQQTLEARLDTFGTICAPRSVRLLYPPVTSIVSVSYLDASRTVVPVDPDSYDLYGDTLEAIGEPIWAGAYCGREALRIQYVAGYDVIPAPIRHAILLIVGDFYRYRETVAIAPGTVAQLPVAATVENLLAPFRVYA